MNSHPHNHDANRNGGFRIPTKWVLFGFAAIAREHRTPVAETNLFLGIERTASGQVSAALDAYRQVRDAAQEATFRALYG